MLILETLGGIFVAVAIVAFFVADARRRPLDKSVKLSADEFTTVLGVANYALKRLGRPDGFLRSVNEARLRNMVNPVGYLPLRRSISRDDLAFLAPYIDEWIAGKAPPQNLPAEYPDERPERLRALKERMQQEGLWPEKAVNR